MHFKFWAVTFSFIFTKLQILKKKKSVFSLWVLQMGFSSYKTCMEHKDYLFMKQGSLFCFVMLRTMVLHAALLICMESSP
jgi:hypothetical protein